MSIPLLTTRRYIPPLAARPHLLQRLDERLRPTPSDVAALEAHAQRWLAGLQPVILDDLKALQQQPERDPNPAPLSIHRTSKEA